MQALRGNRPAKEPMARKKKEEEHENHERWLVSYADFITLLFAFFVVMYAISQVNEGKYRVLSNSLTTAFDNKTGAEPAASRVKAGPGGANAALIQLPYRDARRADQAAKEQADRAARLQKVTDELKQNLSGLMDQGLVHIATNSRGVAIEVSSNLLFPVGAATLDTKATGSLAMIAQKLASSKNLIQIEGHTDNVPISSPQFPSNWELSAARAGTVVRLFEANGIAGQRLVAIGYGDNRPQVPNTDTAGRARNRRVTIQILTDELPDIAVNNAAH